MSKTYFVVSDIHSYFTPLKKALYDAGYKKSNKEHILIVCGDVFDRGDETLQVYNYLKSIPKSRCILIKGNHEELYFELLNQYCLPKQYQAFNGTLKTFMDITKVPSNFMPKRDIETYLDNWHAIQEKISKSPITKWLKSKQWVNYFELGKYIFVHSFIPLKNPSNKEIYGNFDYNKYLEPITNWRIEATKKEWLEATWGCPYKQFQQGLFDKEIANGKILVCGHWSVNDFHEVFDNKPNCYDIYIGKNLIGLDACTALTKKINVLVLKEENLR